MSDVRLIPPPQGFAPKGHYSHAVAAGNFVFVSGQLAITEKGEPATGADVETQTRMCLNNVAFVLQSADVPMDNIVRTTVYVSDVDHWHAVNAVFASFFGAHRPARVIVPVKKLHFDLDVEIDAVAVYGHR